jgi:hypothetical protein
MNTFSTASKEGGSAVDISCVRESCQITLTFRACKYSTRSVASSRAFVSARAPTRRMNNEDPSLVDQWLIFWMMSFCGVSGADVLVIF